MKKRNDLHALPEIKTIRHSILLFLLISRLCGTNDNESWTSIGFEKKLPHSLKLEFEQELRLKTKYLLLNKSSLIFRFHTKFLITLVFRFHIATLFIRIKLNNG